MRKVFIGNTTNTDCYVITCVLEKHVRRTTQQYIYINRYLYLVVHNINILHENDTILWTYTRTYTDRHNVIDTCYTMVQYIHSIRIVLQKQAYVTIFITEQ